MDPAVKEFAATYTDVDFIKIDVDKLMVNIPFIFFSSYYKIYVYSLRPSSQTIWKLCDWIQLVAMQFEANSLPAFVLVKKGKEVDRVVGVQKLELQIKIEQHRIWLYIC